MQPLVLNTKQAAAYIGCTYDRLIDWRRDGGGPPFLLWGKVGIRYRKTDIDEWIEGLAPVQTLAQAAIRRAG